MVGGLGPVRVKTWVHDAGSEANDPERSGMRVDLTLLLLLRWSVVKDGIHADAEANADGSGGGGGGGGGGAPVVQDERVTSGTD